MPIEIQRRVRFDHEDLDAVRMMIRANVENPQNGELIEVEVGARWTTRNGREERVGGVWVNCEVLSDTGRELVVRLAD
jgi:hypothetical protein